MLRMLQRLFRVPERRELGRYTALHMTARRELARIDAETDSLNATVEACVGIWSRAFSMVEATPAHREITPEFLAAVGRDLAIKGQSVWYIDGGRLRRAYTWHHYRSGMTLTMSSPHDTETVACLREECLDIRINTAAVEPWRGRSPGVLATETVDLLAAIERALQAAWTGPTGSVLIHAPAGISPEAADGLSRDLSDRQGRVAVAGTPAMNQNRDQRWALSDLTANVRAMMPEVDSGISARIASAYGVPSPLLNPAAQAQAMREGLRLFYVGTLRPLLRIVEGEIRRKLADVKLDATEYQAADVQGRARAVGSLTQAGLSIPDALDAVGWERYAVNYTSTTTKPKEDDGTR